MVHIFIFYWFFLFLTSLLLQETNQHKNDKMKKNEIKIWKKKIKENLVENEKQIIKNKKEKKFSFLSLRTQHLLIGTCEPWQIEFAIVNGLDLELFKDRCYLIANQWNFALIGQEKMSLRETILSLVFMYFNSRTLQG